MLQAVTPLALEWVPMTILTLGSLNWAPVVNALSVIGSYRRAMMKAFSYLVRGVGKSVCRERSESAAVAVSHTLNVVSPQLSP